MLNRLTDRIQEVWRINYVDSLERSLNENCKLANADCRTLNRKMAI